MVPLSSFPSDPGVCPQQKSPTHVPQPRTISWARVYGHVWKSSGKSHPLHLQSCVQLSGNETSPYTPAWPCCVGSSVPASPPVSQCPRVSSPSSSSCHPGRKMHWGWGLPHLCWQWDSGWSYIAFSVMVSFCPVGSVC